MIKCDNSKMNDMFAELNEAFNRANSSFFDYIGYFYNILSGLNKILVDKVTLKTDAMPEVINYMEECLENSYIDFSLSRRNLT